MCQSIDVKDAPDYFYYEAPSYRDLYDIVLGHIFHELEVCLAVLEVDHLAWTTDVRKQWLLTNGRADYGLLTFSHLDYNILLSWPIVVCDFQAYPLFENIRPVFEQVEREEGPGPLHPNRWPISPIEEVGLHLKPVNQTVRIDKFLASPDDFRIYIIGEEARFHIIHTVVD